MLSMSLFKQYSLIINVKVKQYKAHVINVSIKQYNPNYQC